MKKFYTILAVFATMSVVKVSAQDYTTVDDMCAVYNWDNTDLGGDLSCRVTIKKDGKVENGVIITGIWDKYEVKGTFVYNSDKDSYISIENQRVGFDPEKGEFLSFVHLTYEGQIDPEPLLLDNSMDGDLMTFEEYGIVGETMDGKYIFTGTDDLIEYGYMAWLIRQGALPITTWEDAGTATLFDGGFFTPLPRFGIGFKEPVEVELEKSTETEGLYRLVKPWNSYFRKEYDSYLEFDISDPDCVIIPTQPTGHVDEEYGAASVQNFVGMYIASGFGKDDAYAAITPGKEGEHICTYDDKTKVITIPVNAAFTTFAKDDSYWNVGKAHGAADSYIVMPGSAGIDTVISEDSNAPVEYYNLQGIRIDNPSSGQLVIRRQGSDVKKIIM